MDAAWQDRLQSVAAEVAAVRTRVATSGKVLNRRWRQGIERRGFGPSALNLAHYLVFRQIDLRHLQRRLMALGLSSLGRAEGRVLATLDAVGAALSLMVDEAPPDHARMPSERQFFRGERLLTENALTLFGPPSQGRAGRIMVTLGTEAANDPGLVLDFARRGANLVRINCAHDDLDVWARMIENTRRAARETGRIRILMDIAGPKVRTGDVYSAAGHERVMVGDDLLLAEAIDPARGEFPFQCTCTLSGAFHRVKVGDRMSYDDGVLRGAVTRQTTDGLVVRIDDGKLKGGSRPRRALSFRTSISACRRCLRRILPTSISFPTTRTSSATRLWKRPSMSHSSRRSSAGGGSTGRKSALWPRSRLLGR